MLKVTFPKNKKGNRIRIENANGNIFNHDYNKKSSARKAWNAFVKQIKEGKFKIV